MANDPQMEALIQALSEWGVIPGYKSRLDEQMRMAEHLRNLPMPQGREVSGGRVFVAAHPLEMLMTALARAKGGQEVSQLQGQVPAWAASQGGLLGREQGARQQLMQEQVRQYNDTIRRRLLQGQQPTVPGMNYNET